MSELSLFSRMARNNAWAKGQLLDAVCALPQAAFEAQRVGFFPEFERPASAARYWEA